MPNPDPFFDLDDVRRLARKWAVDCGHLVEQRRVALGFDRRQLAAIVGTTEATIHRVESGVVAPRDYLKMAIAAALAIDVSSLWPYPARSAVFEAAEALA